MYDKKFDNITDFKNKFTEDLFKKTKLNLSTFNEKLRILYNSL